MKKNKQIKPTLAVKLKELAICTPSRDGMFPINFVSTAESILKDVPEGWDIKYSLVRGTSDIVNARNAFFNKWYYESDTTAMLFLDSDVGFRGSDLKKLLEYSEIDGVDFIGGNYTKKVIELPKILQTASKWKTPEIDMKELISASASYVSTGKHILYEDGKFEGLCEIDGIGMGCFLITRKTANKLMSWASENMQKTKFTTFGDACSGYALFNPVSSSEGNYGEDYSFCMRVKEAGLSIFCDPKMEFSHTGNWDFFGKFSHALDYFKKEKITEVNMDANKWSDNKTEQLKK